MTFFSELVFPPSDKPKNKFGWVEPKRYYINDYVTGYNWQFSKEIKGRIVSLKLDTSSSFMEYTLDNGEIIFGYEITDVY